MKGLLLALLICPALAVASDAFICSAQYVDKSFTPPKTLGVKEKEFIVREDGEKYYISSTTSNYKATFITQKDKDGTSFGFDNFNTLFMKNQDGIYSLTFSEPSMKNTFIALINCTPYN